ncbi:PREDICTED: insulin-like growth factor 2 mRNA-binding protein 3-A [Atta cephalotes]|uniref:RRM domain-containing protein n=2 Tax=Atta TaxID=12956 RepID=A0A158NU65_ATTCE|nr:PREDICTED: insulin-like growth factor 2 mRNA-binding protein 3-A [Atta cephalotes]
MSKLYVGNLPSDCNESALRQLFQEHSLACTTILVKRGGYAFVDCADQSTADRAIDKLNGYTYLGSSLVVEPSVASAAKKRTVSTYVDDNEAPRAMIPSSIRYHKAVGTFVYHKS